MWAGSPGPRVAPSSPTTARRRGGGVCALLSVCVMRQDTAAVAALPLTRVRIRLWFPGTQWPEVRTACQQQPPLEMWVCSYFHTPTAGT